MANTPERDCIAKLFADELRRTPEAQKWARFLRLNLRDLRAGSPWFQREDKALEFLAPPLNPGRPEQFELWREEVGNAAKRIAEKADIPSDEAKVLIGASTAFLVDEVLIDLKQEKIQ